MAGMFDWLQGLLGGDPEAQGAAQASQAMEPNVLQYAQDVLSGKMATSGPVGQNAAYDPNRSFRENALRPDGLEAAMSMVGPAAIRAYHASPFLFDQFTLNNLRGGTGGLAQGRGLYFAQKEPVSLDYKRQFQERGTFEGPDPKGPYMDAYEAAKTIPSRIEDPSHIASSVAEGVRRGDDLAHYRNFVRQSDWEPEKKAMWIAALDAAMPYKFKPGPAHMYEVDIHADPRRLLDYDVPLNAQTPEVMRSLEQIPWAQDYLKSGVIRGEGIIPKTAEGVQQFNDVGIPGWKYLDQFSRNLPNATGRQLIEDQLTKLRNLPPAYTTANDLREIKMLEDKLAAQPTHNYVISDPQRTRIEILRKYGLLPPLAAGAGGGLLGEE